MKDLYDGIHVFFNLQPRYSFPYDSKELKNITDSNGLYILFEQGETYKGLDRIVRIGSHDSTDRLIKRLRDHFLASKQRKSIVRKHIGRCLLNIAKDKYLEHWDRPFNKIKDKEKNKDFVDLKYEKEYEEKITEYIRNNFSFTVIPKIYDQDFRDKIEEGLISILAQSDKKVSSKNWLGNFHPNSIIKNAKIWNIEFVNGQQLDLKEFELLVDKINKNK